MPAFFSLTRGKQTGNIALLSILVISAIVVATSISVSLLSVSDLQRSWGQGKHQQAIDFLEGCVEDALIRLNTLGVIPPQISLPSGTCSITTNEQSGNDWTFTAVGISDGYRKAVRIQARRDTVVTVTGWMEVE